MPFPRFFKWICVSLDQLLWGTEQKIEKQQKKQRAPALWTDILGNSLERCPNANVGLSSTTGLDAVCDITVCTLYFCTHPPPGSPSKLKEILTALIPDHSIFKSSATIHSDAHRPGADNKKNLFFFIHPLVLSELPSPVPRLPSPQFPYFSIYAFWSCLCLSFPLFPMSPFLMYISMGLFLRNTLHYHQLPAARLECARQWRHCNKTCAKLAS